MATLKEELKVKNEQLKLKTEQYERDELELKEMRRMLDDVSSDPGPTPSPQ